MIGRPPRDQAERFWEKVTRGAAGDCWLWTAQLDHDGYGVFKFRLDHNSYRAIHAHRAAWWLTNGPPGDLLVRHYVCFNRRCCNPSHLAIGTDADNAADRERHGNTLRGDRSSSRRHPECLARGERHGFAVLDKRSVELILALSETTSQKELAARFGVSKGTIYNVQKGKHWANG